MVLVRQSPLARLETWGSSGGSCRDQRHLFLEMWGLFCVTGHSFSCSQGQAPAAGHKFQLGSSQGVPESGWWGGFPNAEPDLHGTHAPPHTGTCPFWGVGPVGNRALRVHW